MRLPPRWISRRRISRRRCGDGLLLSLCVLSFTASLPAQPAAAPPADPAAPVPADAPPPVQPDPPLPKLLEMQIPTAEELVQGKPRDWIVLLNQDVIVVEPVSPRPGTLESLKSQHDQMVKVPLSQITLEEKQAKLAELQRIQVTLLGDTSDDPEYVIETRFIGQILYFEDLILRRIRLLLDKRELVPAYELMMFLERRHHHWPGYEDEYHRFLFYEATKFVENEQFERALVEAERLFDLKPDYADLSRLMGRAVQGLVDRSIEEDDFRQARHFLARLQKRQPDHEVDRLGTDRLKQLASAAVAAARMSQANADWRNAALQADRAALIWPELAGLKDLHRDMVNRYQILKTGIIASHPASRDYPFPTANSERQRSLCSLTLFEEDHVRDGIVRYRSRFIESWEPRNLGREIQFRMMGRRADWESRPLISSGSIVEALSARVDPQNPLFDARWQRELKTVAGAAPDEWTLQLSRIPLRIESRLRFDLPLNANSTKDLVPAALDHPHQQRFYQAERDTGMTTFQRTLTQPAGPSGWSVAEVRETTYPDWRRLLQGLLRGEVDLIPVAEWADVAALQADRRFFVHQYALPRTHFLQIHPGSMLVEHSSLRRALMHAIDRRIILRDQVLQGASAEWGRLVNGPFATNLAAYDAQLRQPDVDLFRAASLVATVRRQLSGSLPTLRLAVPDDVVAARAVPELLAAWKRIGINVVVVAPGEEIQWDLAYRTVRLAEPIDDLWSLLHPQERTDWESLSIYPHWLRERLWELEQAVDWSTAQRLLRQIQAEFLVEARWIPLWEVDEFLVARRRMTGLSARPMSAYQNIERWTVQSWYPTETP